jgi:hypothetical protein
LPASNELALRVSRSPNDPCDLDRSRGKDPDSPGQLAQLRLGRPPLAVQQLDDQLLDDRLLVDFLGGQLLGC